MREQTTSWLVVLLLAGVLLSGCSDDAGTGPIDVKWDRDICARCNMVLSDRAHAAQIRFPSPHGPHSQVETFDDIGCAVLWLDQQPWQSNPGVEIWVTDYRSGKWIDAREAHYVAGRNTPMQYGLGAQVEAGPNTIDFAAAREHIHRVEETLNIHGGNLGHEAPSISRPPTE